MNDPRLRANEEQREEGGWDFTEDFYAERAWRSQVEHTLDELRLATQRATFDRDKAEAGNNMKDLWTLRRECKAAGGEGTNHWSIEKCQEFLSSASAERDAE